MSTDVIVVGGGAIGLAVADHLARQGETITLIDATAPGRKASWAASGSLSLIVPQLAPPALRTLASASLRLWPSMAADLEERSGICVELLNMGLLRLALSQTTSKTVQETQDWFLKEGIECRRLNASEIHSLAPLVTPQASDALFQPDLACIRPPRLLRALLAVIGNSPKVKVVSHSAVRCLLINDSRVGGVILDSGVRISAREVILCAGTWSGELLRPILGSTLPIRPIRGQIVCLDEVGIATGSSPLLLGEMNYYLVPRPDGRVLAGSTFEDVGFDERVTAGGLEDILRGAIEIAPALTGARLANSWAGLRPGTPDGLPFLGRISGLEGLIVATGHFRDGLLLTPVTARIITTVLSGASPELDLTPYSPDRVVPAASELESPAGAARDNAKGPMSYVV